MSIKKHRRKLPFGLSRRFSILLKLVKTGSRGLHCTAHVNRVPLLLLHLSQKQQHRGGENDDGIAKNPPQVWEDACIVAGDSGTLHFDGMDKGQGIGDLFEDAAHKVKVEPNAREPSREIGHGVEQSPFKR